jgi:hypothetical protein
MAYEVRKRIEHRNPAPLQRFAPGQESSRTASRKHPANLLVPANIVLKGFLWEEMLDGAWWS